MRDALIIGIAALAALFIGAWLYLEGNTAASSLLGSAGFSVLDEGTNAGSVTERKNYRITSQDQLNALWNMVHGTDGPSVDFTTHEVLALFDGTHATGGYDVTLESMDDAGGVRAVVIRHELPGEACTTTSAVTSPYEIVVVSKSAYPLKHTDEETIKECN